MFFTYSILPLLINYKCICFFTYKCSHLLSLTFDYYEFPKKIPFFDTYFVKNNTFSLQMSGRKQGFMINYHIPCDWLLKFYYTMITMHSLQEEAFRFRKQLTKGVQQLCDIWDLNHLIRLTGKVPRSLSDWLISIKVF